MSKKNEEWDYLYEFAHADEQIKKWNEVRQRAISDIRRFVRDGLHLIGNSIIRVAHPESEEPAVSIVGHILEREPLISVDESEQEDTITT